MQLQFGIFDYIIIAVFYGLAGAVLILAWLFLHRWKHWPAVIFPLAVAAVVLPWADEIWIAWHFRKLCGDAGLHVSKKVEVDGFYDSIMQSGYEYVDKYGYRYIEHPSATGGKVDRIEKINGAWVKLTLEQPTARYHYKYTDGRQKMSAGYRLEKREVVVVDTATGDILARETGYNRYGGWIQKLWINRIGSDLVQCPDPGKGPPREHLPTAVLKTRAAK